MSAPTARALTRSHRAIATSAAVAIDGAQTRAPVALISRPVDQRHEHMRRCERRSAAKSIAALALGAAALAASSQHTQCESLQQLDASKRRHTGTTPQKPSSAGASDTVESDDVTDTSEPSQGVYFDADYETKSLVGAGSFGMVLQCVHKRDGHVAAVKMIQDVVDTRDEIVRETQALASIARSGGHAHIVRFDGAYAHNGFHYIVTEFVHGESLFAFLETRKHVDVRTALQLTAQLADALAFLQARGIVHRDLKPENIMVERSSDDQDNDGTDGPERLQLKIIDFGSAATLAPSAIAYESAEDEEDDDDRDTRQVADVPIALSGTRCYWSPEVLLHGEMTPAMDVWALGCVLYILISGRHPFDLMGASTEQQIVNRIVARDHSVSFAHPVWTSVPPDVKALVRGLLEKDPCARLSIDAVRSHASVRAACAS